MLNFLEASVWKPLDVISIQHMPGAITLRFSTDQFAAVAAGGLLSPVSVPVVCGPSALLSFSACGGYEVPRLYRARVAVHRLVSSAGHVRAGPACLEVVAAIWLSSRCAPSAVLWCTVVQCSWRNTAKDMPPPPSPVCGALF